MIIREAFHSEVAQGRMVSVTGFFEPFPTEGTESVHTP